MRKPFYVKAETSKSKVIAYGVFDCVGGMESEHQRFAVSDKQSAEVSLHLANTCRDDMNAATPTK